ncbi:hypothetical protein GDO78_023177 [Eleutherodactylus coqui]|uniref:Uncharacterized protein n=1 Tax=Eleutherodactylus coqui TaxID=57060 RepID=A0A8J6ELP6_ELECQ|nr:hypothetical protein GDO78_023177 [Eleutherodactylus coqui]
MGWSGWAVAPPPGRDNTVRQGCPSCGGSHGPVGWLCCGAPTGWRVPWTCGGCTAVLPPRRDNTVRQDCTQCGRSMDVWCGRTAELPLGGGSRGGVVAVLQRSRRV